MQKTTANLRFINLLCYSDFRNICGARRHIQLKKSLENVFTPSFTPAQMLHLPQQMLIFASQNDRL